MRRHNGCSRQTQPPAPDSGRDFARRATSTRQANTREQVTAEIIEEHPVRHHRLKGAEWSRHMSQLFAEYMTQSELGDYNRLTSIIVAILSSKPATTRPVSAQIHSQDQFWRARKALKILHTSGRKGKAMDALREGKPYVISAENEDEIRRLFLPRTSPLVIPDEVWTDDQFGLTVSTEVVQKILASKHPHTGKGPSGIGYDDLQRLAVKYPLFLSHLTRLANDLINGKLPRDSDAVIQLKAARGVAIEKANGKPRPIGVREVITNLAYAAISKQETEAIKAHLTPFDFGFRVKNGTALPAITIQSHIDSAKKRMQQLFVIRIDIENAYPTTSRSAILELLKTKLPHLVRSFLVTHQNPTKMKFPNMDEVEMSEGLIQGDPMAPAYAQLMYSDCCSKVRAALEAIMLIMSFFDDIFILDQDLDIALRAVELLDNALDSIGCRRSRSKTLMFALQELNASDASHCADLGIQITYEGIKVLGTPVGTPDYITRQLEEVAQDILRHLEQISNAETLGVLNKSYASVQGLYHVARDCANNLGKHLLRTVDPRITQASFAEVDAVTMQTVARMFDIEAITPFIRDRLILPGSLGGFGLTPYVEAAIPMYLGCLYDCGLSVTGFTMFDPGEALDSLPWARTKMIESLDAEERNIVPDLQSFFQERESQEDALLVNQEGGRSQTLSQRLQKKLHDKRFKRLNVEAEGLKKFILQVTSHETAVDWLYAPMTKRKLRMYSAFKIYARFFLGEPVTAERCTLGKCNHSVVTPDGEHGWHAPARITARHNKVKEAIALFLSRLHANGQSEMECRMETHLSELGHTPKEGASDGSDAKCDFYLLNEITNRLFVADVLVTHPNVRQNTQASSTPLWTAEQGYKRKMKRYCGNYDSLSPNMVIPLVFETYGGWHEKSKQFLHEVVKSIAGEDNELFSKLWMDLRYRIGVALAVGHAEVIRAVNSKQTSRHNCGPQRAQPAHQHPSKR